MRLIVGPGNPGPRYFGTRHNVGFVLLDALARRHAIAIHAPRFHGQYGEGRIGDQDVGLLKPTTFVNRSGSAVELACASFPELDPSQDLLLVYDDLDLPFGRLRMRARGGAGGHNGVADVIDRLGSRDVPRLRFGIGRPPAQETATPYVLERFTAQERSELERHGEQALRAIEAFIAEGAERAMNEVNRETVAVGAPTRSD